jgi:hypothetical protein
MQRLASERDSNMTATTSAGVQVSSTAAFERTSIATRRLL